MVFRGSQVFKRRGGREQPGRGGEWEGGGEERVVAVAWERRYMQVRVRF
jgi:hypothetical protein